MSERDRRLGDVIRSVRDLADLVPVAPAASEMDYILSSLRRILLSHQAPLVGRPSYKTLHRTQSESIERLIREIELWRRGVEPEFKAEVIKKHL